MSKQQTIGFMTRREALKRVLLGAAGLVLTDPFRLQARSAPLDLNAKSVIQIWMWGGPKSVSE
jgi:hypothetical protein